MTLTRKHLMAGLGGGYGLWLAYAYAVLLSASPRYGWHFVLYAFVGVMLWRPAVLRPRTAGRQPTAVHFAAIAVLWSAFIAMPLAALLRGDLHPNLIVNSLLWLGACAGLAAAWGWLLRRYRWSLVSLWAVSGLLALTEPGHVLLRAAYQGEWSGVFILFPVLHTAHACLILPVANAYRQALPGPQARAPALAGHVLAACLAGTAFLVGNGLWLLAAKHLGGP